MMCGWSWTEPNTDTSTLPRPKTEPKAKYMRHRHKKESAGLKAWYGNWGQKVQRDYPKWSAKYSTAK